MLSRVIDINQKTIIVNQDLSLSHAGTVWDGALVLAYYLHKNKQVAAKYFHGKKVVELGSGTGILGLATTAFGPRVLYLTDLKQYLPILQQNCELNRKNLQNNQTKMQVVALKWGCAQDMDRIGKVDTVIGSQLAYDKQNIKDLTNTFLHYLRVNPEVVIIIGYQKYENPLRNLQVVLSAVKQLHVEEVDPSDMDDDYYDQGIGILIMTKAQHA